MWPFDDNEDEQIKDPAMQIPKDLSNDEDYQALLRQRLLDKMNQQERGLLFDNKSSGEAAASEGDAQRGIILSQALAKGAAQIGTLGGKAADTSAVDDSTKAYLDANKSGLDLAQKSRSDRDKLNQYLMGKMLEQEGALGKRKSEQATLEAQAKREEGKQAFTAGQNELDRKNRAAIAKMEADAKAMNKKSGEQVPGGVAAELGQFDSALAMADDIYDSYKSKASAAGSSVKSGIAGTDANKYMKDRDVTAQAIGTILEQGKLTDTDYERYKSMLPSPWDTNATAKTKIAAIKNLIAQRRKGKVQGLAQTGFDVSGVKDITPEGFESKKPKSNSAVAGSDKPKKIIQNGHTYILNEKTGEYE